VHNITLVEGYSDSLRKFEEEMNGRIYANGKCKLRIREVKLYTSSFNRIGYNEVMSDFLALERMFGCENSYSFKWKSMYKAAELLGKPLGIKKIDKANIKSNPMFGKPRADGGITYNAHFYNLGVVPDYVDKDGVEQV
jgi:hypothetical protein